MIDTYILEAAILGLLEQRKQIDATIAEVQARLGGANRLLPQSRRGEPTATYVVDVTQHHKPPKELVKRRKVRKDAGKRKPRRMSKAGREAIAAAQRKRWAKIRREKKAAERDAKKRKSGILRAWSKSKRATKRPAPRMVEMEATA